MNSRLVLSLLANLLLGLLAFVLILRRPVTPPVPAPVVAAAPVRVAAPTPAPFRWSQLESSDDYRVFLTNLRAIGCPENIVRAIALEDVQEVFAFKRRALHLTETETGPWSHPAELALANRLLGYPAAPATVAAQSPAPESVPRLPPPQRAPEMPLVLAPVDEQKLPLTDEQKQVMAQLQQRFLDEIGGPDQDPNDPAYLQRWQKAQTEVNDTLRGLLGSKFFVQLQVQAAYSPMPGTP
jgi:hypothetical protein